MNGTQRMTSYAIAVCLLAAMAAVGVDGESSSPVENDSDLPEPTSSTPFSQNFRVSNRHFGYANQIEPSMVVDSKGKIYVAWTEQDPLVRGTRIAYAYSEDGGSTWPVSDIIFPAGSRFSEDAWLAVSEDDRVYISECVFDLNNDLLGVGLRSTTDGLNWDPPSFLPQTTNRPHKETMVVDSSGKAYFLWNRWDLTTGSEDVVFVRTDDTGSSWTSEVYVADTQNYALGGYILLQSSGTVLASWYSYGTRDILFDRSLDGGSTWNKDVRVNDKQGTVKWLSRTWTPLPAMAVAPDGKIHVVWADARFGNLDIFSSRSLDGGLTWQPAVQVSDNITGVLQWLPDIAVDPFGGVHVAWVDSRNSAYDVYYANSTDGGASFGPNVRVTTESTPLNNSNFGDYISLESDADGTIYVAWTDGRGSDLDIYFAKSYSSPTITIDTVPTGLDVVVDHVLHTAPHDIYCKPNSTILLEAPSPQTLGQTQYVFSSWSDGGSQVHSINCTSSGSFVATYAAVHRVDIDTSPPNLQFVADGTAFTAPQTFWWLEGSPHDLDAPSPQGGPLTRHVFDSWSDDMAKTHSVIITGPSTFNATFRTQHLLTLQSQYGSPACSNADCWFDDGSMAGFSVEGTVLESSGTRHAFHGWTGDSAATENFSTIVMDGPKAVTATWDTQHLLTIHSQFGSPVCSAADCWFEEGSTAGFFVEEVILESWDTRHIFEGWTGDSTATENSSMIVMDSPKNVTANWATQYLLTLQSQFSSPSCSNADCWFDEGSTAGFSIAETMLESADTRHVFQGWSGDSASTGNPATILMDGPKTVTATWVTRYLLTVHSQYGSPVCSNADCWFDEGSIARFSVEETVSESADTRHRFQGWSGDSMSIQNYSTMLMDDPKTITATWITQYLLTILSEHGTPQGAGWHIEGSVASVSIEERVTVDGTELLFVGWTGDLETTAASASVTMNDPKTLTANWQEVQTVEDAGIALWPLLIIVAAALLLAALILWRYRRKRTDTPESKPKEPSA